MKDRIRVVGLGAGGHAKVVIEILRLMEGCELVGLLDCKRELWGTKVLGIPVLGNDDLLIELYADGVRDAFIGVGSVGSLQPRQRLYEKAVEQGFRMVSAAHRHAVISPSAKVGRGCTIMAGAVINAAATLGDNVIVNTGAVVEHDCVVGNHVHLATGSKLASTVQVGDGTHIGLGACVRQCARIGQHVIVGAGAVVLDDVPDDTVVAGVPARPIWVRARS